MLCVLFCFADVLYALFVNRFIAKYSSKYLDVGNYVLIDEIKQIN